MLAFRKVYSSASEFQADFETNLKNGGLLVESEETIETRKPAKITLTVGTQTVGELEGETVYAAPMEKGFRVGLELKGDWLNLLAAIKEKLVAPPSDEKNERDERWGKDSESLFHAIEKMTTPEKIQLAIKGGRAERRILLKDTHYMVHSYVLKNPRLTTDEVAQISRMSNITGEMILAITNNGDWMQNSTIRLAIVKNPKTPANIVQKHIGQLRDSDLMQMAKSEHVRDNVSKAARRVLAGRGKVVR
ncbi:MAG TPA: hypothetical protein VI895_00555 [Bdellovibrionota bacterium]|nr:hypothetical protein [Bdellovibrionota bacterium]